MRRVKTYIFAALLLSVLISYIYFGSRYGDSIDARQPLSDDPYYIIAKDDLIKRDHAFLFAAGKNLRAVKIVGNKNFCYFFFSSKPIAYDGNDILYCFGKDDKNSMSRM